MARGATNCITKDEFYSAEEGSGWDWDFKGFLVAGVAKIGPLKIGTDVAGGAREREVPDGIGRLVKTLGDGDASADEELGVSPVEVGAILWVIEDVFGLESVYRILGSRDGSQRLREAASDARNARLFERGTQLRQGLSQDWRDDGSI
jgi:hypothetical protein